jgi:hypothetical protein
MGRIASSTIGHNNENKTKLRGLSPRANYTDRSLSVKLMPTFVDRGVLRSQRGGSPTAVNSDF